MKINICLFLLAGILLLSCNYNPYAQGKLLYESQCSGCHGKDGLGFKDLYPPLKDSDFFTKDPYAVTCIITNGMEGSILVNGKTYDQPMQAIEGLTPVQITNILNYIGTWNPSIPGPINVQKVKEKITECEKQPKVY